MKVFKRIIYQLWDDDGWSFKIVQNYRTMIWHAFVSFTIPRWMQSCNRHFEHTLVASPTMAFERQTAVRAAGQSSTEAKVFILFDLRQPKFSIMPVSLQCKETFVSQPCPFPGFPKRFSLCLKVFELAQPLLFSSLLFWYSIVVKLS